jgi:hypothetical protein
MKGRSWYSYVRKEDSSFYIFDKRIALTFEERQISLFPTIYHFT